eukprot:c16594_g1_i1.p1 GENE.c16594_g1_i1~~c16594_g1_i1.p1  ORF type:complete len:218 (+),score=46.30 c16594_g1_i1:53-706(+)
MNIQFCALIRLSDQALLCSHGPLDRYFNTEATNVVKEVSLLPEIKKSERCVLPTNAGPIHCYRKNGYLFAAICKEGYPSRVAFAFLLELESTCSGAFSKPMASDAQIKATHIFSDLARKYDDPAKIDKTCEIMQQLDQVEKKMQENLYLVLERGENLQKVQNRAEDLSRSAQKFKDEGKQLAIIEKRRNMKLKLTVILLFSCVLIYIVLPFIQSAVE